MSVTCRDCAIPYEVWPGRCPNCGCGEPAPEVEELAPLPEFDGEAEHEHPGTGIPPDLAAAAPGGEAEVLPDYAEWTVAELRAECERQGLPTSGTKAVLVVRLAGG